MEWLRKPSQFTGVQRFEMFKRAEAAGDVERVAQFFVEFKQSRNASQQLLEEQQNPMGRGGNNAPPQHQQGNRQNKQPEEISFSEINQFYDDDIAGKYRDNPQLRDELDKKYDLALKEGRVTY
jgi:hypothetical protein